MQELQALIETWWSTVTTELDRSHNHGEGEGQTRLERIADASLAGGDLLEAWLEEHDEQRALLPRLLAVLTPQERQLLGYRYLRETPLSHEQIRVRMGLSKRRQLAMEQAAIERLRAAAEKLQGGVEWPAPAESIAA